jgi:hypothetical protein
MCITFFEHSWYFFLHSCFKNNIKKNVLDLKIFHFSQKFWKKYVVMATMIMCKTFCEHSWYKIFNSYFKNNNKKNGQLIWKILGEICCHGNHYMCNTFYETFQIFFLIFALKIIEEKKRIYLKNFNFSQKSRGKICCHGNHDKVCLQSFEI